MRRVLETFVNSIPGCYLGCVINVSFFKFEEFDGLTINHRAKILTGSYNDSYINEEEYQELLRAAADIKATHVEQGQELRIRVGRSYLSLIKDGSETYIDIGHVKVSWDIDLLCETIKKCLTK